MTQNTKNVGPFYHVRSAPQQAAPAHVALVMHGNGRWARARGDARPVGHVIGAMKSVEVYRACQARGVQFLSFYAFSVANWQRPAREVNQLMDIFAEYAHSQLSDFQARSIRFMAVGDLNELPTHTRRRLESTMSATADNDKMTLSMMINYGGRTDLVQASRALAAQVQAGVLLPEEVDESALKRFMHTTPLPDVDLLIRTGGEQRLSDFMLFDAAYAELYFDDVLWPDYTEDHLDEALAEFHRRDRRFGGVKAAPTQAAVRPAGRVLQAVGGAR